MLSRATCTAWVLASTLTACASPQPPSPAPQIPASLRQPCPALPPLTDGQGGTVLRWITDAALMYRECAAGKDALARAARP